MRRRGEREGENLREEEGTLLPVAEPSLSVVFHLCCAVLPEE